MNTLPEKGGASAHAYLVDCTQYYPFWLIQRALLYFAGRQLSIIINCCNTILPYCSQVSSGQSLLTACSVEFHCQQLKSHCQQSQLATACSEQSLMATASSEKLLLPTASSCVRAYAYVHVCWSIHASFDRKAFYLYAVLQRSYTKLNPFRREKWTVTAVTASSDRCVSVRVCMRARVCMRYEIYIYHSTDTISTCLSLYNVLTQNSIPLEGYSCYGQ